MKKPKVVSHSGLTVNLAQVKCIRLSTFQEMEKNTMIVEYITRSEYVYNPGTKEYEIQEYNDTCQIEFPDYQMARDYRNEWEAIWQDYLDEQEL